MTKDPIQIGDIFEIPLKEKRKSYGKYLYLDTYGPIILVYDLITPIDEKLDISTIKKSSPLFPPIYTGLFVAIRSKRWKVIYKDSVEEFLFPGFLTTLKNPKTGEATIWFLWNGKEKIKLGKTLDNKHKKYEFLAIYPPDLVVKRIEGGKNPYEKLIFTNKM